MRRFLLGLVIFLGSGVALYVAWVAWTATRDEASACYGNPRNGRLENAKQMPAWGENYRAYSYALWLLGRASMHGSVRDVVEAAYADVAATNPELRFVYGEAAWPWGGQLWPHKTHRNGLSVDFFVPVRTDSGAVDELTTQIYNRWGYDAHFDNSGKAGGTVIDFDAIAKHLSAIAKAARERGVGISLVILENELRQVLLSDPARAALVAGLPFSEKRAWVRHDNHYHIDFDVPCGGRRRKG